MHTTLLLCSERSLAILIFSQRLRYVLDKYTNLHRSKRGSTCITKVSHLCYACLAHKSQRVLFAQFVGERAEVIVGSAAMLVLKWWGICRSLPSSNFTFPDHLWKKNHAKIKVITFVQRNRSFAGILGHILVHSSTVCTASFIPQLSHAAACTEEAVALL